MARRRPRTAPGGDLRAVLAEQERNAFADFRRSLDPYGRLPPSPRAEDLEAGKPVVFHGWQLADLVPGVNVHTNYRVEPDGSLTEVYLVPGDVHDPIRWEPVG